jgi:outer membrane protein OmpA-like peptidoglycan-associated protein
MNTHLKLLSGVAVLALAACSSVPLPNANLEAARSSVSQAAATPDVSRLAPSELARAREALNRADKAWSDNRDDAETAHLAYLASQRAQIAINLAAQRGADLRVADASAERERIRADVRTREAVLAQQRAQSAQMQAQSAQIQAQNATAEAQNAQAQAQSATAIAMSESERANRLQRELEQLAAKQTDHGMVVSLQDVLFDVGRASLRSGAQARLDQLAAVLRNYPERRVLVEGFTDSTGSEETNLTLSQARAEAVRAALMAKGVAANRIDVRGFGESRPIASNATAAGRQQNRRVEVVFSDARGQFAGLQ